LERVSKNDFKKGGASGSALFFVQKAHRIVAPDFLEIMRCNGQSCAMSDNADLAALIRNIPDHPKPGIMFRDVSSLLLDAGGYRTTIDRLWQPSWTPIRSLSPVLRRAAS
jgi:hypothetical protein